MLLYATIYKTIKLCSSFHYTLRRPHRSPSSPFKKSAKSVMAGITSRYGYERQISKQQNKTKRTKRKASILCV